MASRSSAAALAFSLFSAVVYQHPVTAQEPAAQTPVVVTNGEGVIKAAPDRAFITASVESRARVPRDAQRQSAAAMTAVHQKLLQIGVAKEAIRTTAYDLQQEFDYVNGKQTSRGYVARNAIEVRLDEVERVGDVIDAAIGAGATTVSDIQFDLRDRDALEREALKQAVADARARADAAASGAGRTIDRILRIEESGARIAPPVPQFRMAAAEAAPPPTPIAAGQIEIRARVTLTAALK